MKKPLILLVSTACLVSCVSVQDLRSREPVVNEIISGNSKQLAACAMNKYIESGINPRYVTFIPDADSKTSIINETVDSLAIMDAQFIQEKPAKTRLVIRASNTAMGSPQPSAHKLAQAAKSCSQ